MIKSIEDQLSPFRSHTFKPELITASCGLFQSLTCPFAHAVTTQSSSKPSQLTGSSSMIFDCISRNTPWSAHTHKKKTLSFRDKNSPGIRDVNLKNSPSQAGAPPSASSTRPDARASLPRPRSRPPSGWSSSGSASSLGFRRGSGPAVEARVRRYSLSVGRTAAETFLLDRTKPARREEKEGKKGGGNDRQAFLRQKRKKTYSFRSVQHADIEIPKEQAAVFANAAEAVIPFIASPGIECDAADPGVVAWTSCDEATFR